MPAEEQEQVSARPQTEEQEQVSAWPQTEEQEQVSFGMSATLLTEKPRRYWLGHRQRNTGW